MTQYLKRQYSNKSEASGARITEAAPADDRLHVEEETSLLSISPNSKDLYPGVMYDGMVITAKDTKRTFMWAESAYGLIDGGYTYPKHFNNIKGQNYANKTYNLVLSAPVAKVTATYTSNVDGVLRISKNSLPISILLDMDSAQVSMKSSADNYADIHYPESLYSDADNLIIGFDPAPIEGETFKVTIF